MSSQTINACGAKFLAFFCVFGLLLTFGYLFYFLEYGKNTKCDFFYNDNDYQEWVRQEALVINWSLLMFFVYSVGLLGIVADSKLLITFFGILKLCIVFFCLQTRRFDSKMLLLLVLGNGTIAFLSFYVSGLFADIPFIEPKYVFGNSKIEKEKKKSSGCYVICDKIETIAKESKY